MKNPCADITVCEMYAARPTTYVEHLITLARKVNSPQDQLVITCNEVGSEEIAAIKVALDLVRRGPGFVFQALVEDWDPLYLNRQLY